MRACCAALVHLRLSNHQNAHMLQHVPIQRWYEWHGRGRRGGGGGGGGRIGHGTHCGAEDASLPVGCSNRRSRLRVPSCLQRTWATVMGAIMCQRSTARYASSRENTCCNRKPEGDRKNNAFGASRVDAWLVGGRSAPASMQGIFKSWNGSAHFEECQKDCLLVAHI